VLHCLAWLDANCNAVHPGLNCCARVQVDSEPKKLFNALPVLFVTGVQAKDKKKSGNFETPWWVPCTALPACRLTRPTGPTGLGCSAIQLPPQQSTLQLGALPTSRANMTHSSPV
jgi:hypothetical protein